jgi:ABC-type tungstate transport system substrate-binding protein
MDTVKRTASGTRLSVAITILASATLGVLWALLILAGHYYLPDLNVLTLIAAPTLCVALLVWLLVHRG